MGIPPSKELVFRNLVMLAFKILRLFGSVLWKVVT